ncbi:cupin domain protein [Aspergillus heteromorphus CBS 117.55]|uniref:CENP-C homolog n=1 Tax=Aspergillus heteromorphus CBS 117.55 TaxID=1448321 RepID=A0A317UXV9_9EURO|nr:cupin domain protein [Aspergillus heteromorphus CBS 117.55]PWY65342.1 cupin domain protein [Aspergillus heteromorphus CBS 117.55]
MTQKADAGDGYRRTGITLKEGRRDEHGMEEVDGIFSSPENSPVKEIGFNNGNETSIGSDGMSMDEGNGPGPADFLKGRRASYFPPPVARSPRKTGLTGSPRRTPGLRSSQSPQRERLSSSPSDGKGLGSTRGESRRGISPLTSRSINAAPSFNHVNGARNTKGNDKTPAEAMNAGFLDSDASSQLSTDENGHSLSHIRDDFVDSFNAGDDTLMGDPADDPVDHGAEMDAATAVASESRKKKRQARSIPKAKRGASSSRNRIQNTTQDNETEEEPTQKRKFPGRPPRAQHKPDDETGDQRPTKKARVSDTSHGNPSSSGDAELDMVVKDYVNRTGPLKGRSLYILKREAPSDVAATHTRSGRVSVRPLAYWRNERCVYGDGEAVEGQRYPLSTIKEIIRTEELEPEKPKANKRRPSKSSKFKKNKGEDTDDDEEYIDPWEKESGVLHGYIRKWDPEIQAVGEDEEIVDLAYAPSGIETRSVKDSSWRFAKLLSSPFLGSGIVELPPGGVKKPKNSKKMHMVFYICNGRVQVDVSGVRFSAGKGCVFQVPRGNYYSFANTHNKDARLFFTQGCVPVENDGSAPGSATKPGAMDGDSSTPTGRPTGAVKGRPRGKQKTGGGRKAM